MLFEFALYFAYIFLALMSLLARTTVSAILYLIALFILTALCYVAAGAEFLGILLVIVYVGAVAVLFLFAVMTLNQEERHANQRPGRNRRLEFVLIPAAAALLALLCSLVAPFLTSLAQGVKDYQDWFNGLEAKPNAETLGSVLYTHFGPLVVLLAVTLLVAMIASIVLTLGSGSRSSERSQDKFAQLDRQLPETVHLRPGQARRRRLGPSNPDSDPRDSSRS